MRLLLDTHAFLWWLRNDDRLGARARDAVADPVNAVFVGAASAWEIAVKRAAGRLTAPGDITAWIEESAFRPLAIEVRHALVSAELPPHHRDPFDRLLVAQAQLEDLALVAHDEELRKYEVGILDAGR